MDYLVLPEDISSLSELEEWKNKFDTMSYQSRLVSDNMSIEAYGFTNIQRYNDLKEKFLKNIDPNNNFVNPGNDNFSLKDFLANLEESSDMSSDQVYNYDLDTIVNRVYKAEADGLVIMFEPYSDFNAPTPDDSIAKLKAKWDAYNSLPENKRILSNQTAASIFGMDNITLYNKILNFYLTAKDHPEKGSFFYSSTQLLSKICTYYAPGGTIDYSSANPVVSESGTVLDEYTWCTKLSGLSSSLQYAQNTAKRESIRSQILEMGWNPEIPFTVEMAERTWLRHTAPLMELTTLKKTMDTIEQISDNIDIAQLKEKIIPVFVVLVEGKALHSKGIKWFTDSKWSHVSMSFDSSLETLYTFTVQSVDKKIHNGFNVENISKYIKKAENIKVCALFVTPDQRDAMKDAIEWYIENESKTHYNFGAIFRMAVRKPTKETDKDAMVCSQFVYSILLLAGFRLSKNKAPNTVSPGDIDDLANDARFYALYEGAAKDYKQKVVDKLILKLLPALPKAMYGLEESTKHGGFNRLYEMAQIVLNNK